MNFQSEDFHIRLYLAELFLTQLKNLLKNTFSCGAVPLSDCDQHASG